MKSFLRKTSESQIYLYLIAFQAIWLVVALIPGVQFLIRILLLLFLFILLLWRLGGNQLKTGIFNLLIVIGSSVIAIKFLFSLLEDYANYVLQFISLGIDNDPHLQMLKDMALVNGQIPLISYPSGQQTLWYLLGKLAGVSYDSVEEVLATYGSLYLFTLLSIVILISRILKKLSIESDGNFFKGYFILILMFFGSFSYMIVGGYPHYMWAFLNVLLVTNLIIRTTQVPIILLSSTLVTWILFITCQPFAFISGLFTLITLWQSFKSIDSKSKLKISNSILVFSLVFLASVTFIVFYWLAKTNVIQQVSDPAAAESLSSVQIVVTLTFIFLAVLKKKTWENSNLRNFVFAHIVLSSVMGIFTFIQQGFITYYAVKQIQFTLFFLVVIALSVFSYKNSNLILKIGATLLVISQFIIVLNPKNFTSAIMGSGFKAFVTLTRPDQWKEISIDANQLILDAKEANLDKDECAIYWLPDRNLISKSTWVDAISPKGQHACMDYAFLAYVSNEDEMKQIFEKSEKHFVVLFESSKPPQLDLLSGPNVRFVEISKP